MPLGGTFGARLLLESLLSVETPNWLDPSYCLAALDI